MIAEPKTGSPSQANPCCNVACTELPQELTGAAGIFKALSDESRLRILRALARHGELCECNMVPSFGLSQPTISYHLKILRQAGLIRSRRQGQWVYHRLEGNALLRAIRSLTSIQDIEGNQ